VLQYSLKCVITQQLFSRVQTDLSMQMNDSPENGLSKSATHICMISRDVSVFESEFECCQKPTIIGKSESLTDLHTRLCRIRTHRLLHKTYSSFIVVCHLPQRSKQMHTE